MQQTIHYSMLIQWSEKDQVFLVPLPEWAHQIIMPATHGDTYDEAARNGREVLELLIDDVVRGGELLPTSKIYIA
jgi:antitoxin HicB